VLPSGDTSAGKPINSSAAPQVVVEAPGEAPRSVPLEQTAPDHFEARIPEDQGGLYRIVSGSSRLVLPEAGFYHEADETKLQSVNAQLLGEISRVTGGRMHPSIEQLLTDKGSLVREQKPLWPYWLILALLLNLLELALRKGFFERLASSVRLRVA